MLVSSPTFCDINLEGFEALNKFYKLFYFIINEPDMKTQGHP